MIKLRPDQVQLKQDIEAAWGSGAQNVLAVAPTGFGKSVLIGEITSQTAAAGLSMTIIAHRNELVSQMSGHVARRGVQHDIIAPRDVVRGIMDQHRAEFAGQSFYAPRSRIRVVGVDTLLARSTDLAELVRGTDVWVTDECFPAGTPIRTATGDRPIEQLRVGDLVTAFDERTGEFHERRVTRLFKNPAPLCMVRIDTGREHLVMTLGHPVWTQRGWIEAGNLRSGDLLYRHGSGWTTLLMHGLHHGDGFVYNIEVDEFHTYVANSIVVHNCHHLVRDNKWHTATEMMPRARGLGVTGSPTRADGQGLGRHADGVMDVMVQGPTLRQLIEIGALSDYQIICAESDLKRPEVVSANGDYSPQQLKKAREKSHIVGDVVDVYIKHAFGMRTIVFATDVEGAAEMADRMRQLGIRAEAVSGKTDPTVRRDIVARFRSGALDVLVNVDLFDEGFDVPACECVIMARPTESLAKYLQQFGRALRTAQGKAFGLLIDMVSNVFGRHGLPDKPHRWTLDRRDKRAKRAPDPDDVGVAVCRSCSKAFDRALRVCPHCGTPQLRDATPRTLEQVDGDLTLVSPEMLQRLRQAAQLESPDSVAARVGKAAGPHAAKSALRDQIERIAAHNELAEAIAWWAGLQRAKGRDDGEIYRRFYLATGQDMVTALSGKRAELIQLTETVRQWNQSTR